MKTSVTICALRLSCMIVVPTVACGATPEGPAVMRKRPAASQALAQQALQPVDANAFCVTEGDWLTDANTKLLKVRQPRLRAVLNTPGDTVAEVEFVYHGATKTFVLLASGDTRQQVGIKLQAADACNVVYIMWRLGNAHAITVSTKLNPGEHASNTCGNRGYVRSKPLLSVPVPTVLPETRHVLRAELTDYWLRAYADGNLVWEGDIGDTAAALRGPVGIRCDNVALDLEFRTHLREKTTPAKDCP